MFDVNKLQVAKPCNIGWENMSGDERKRHCGECKQNVYNIADMSPHQVKELIAEANGSRLCIRLFKRSDGTVLTKDCPVGFRAYQKRIAKFAGAAFATVLGLFTFAPAQTTTTQTSNPITISTHQTSEASLSGTVTDPNGGQIPGLKVFLFQDGKKKHVFKTMTSSTGQWNFKNIKPGKYVLQFSEKNGIFKKTVIKDIIISDDMSKTLNVTVELSDVTVTVGLLIDEPMIDTTSSGITFTMESKRIKSLPF